MAYEVGKTRIEALGEVEEAADLIRYYAKTAEDNEYYDHAMDNLGDAAVHTRSILRPHGVFAVISPFNFPMALSAGPIVGGHDGRQHGRLQAGAASAPDGGASCRGVPRRGRAGRRVQPGHGAGRHRRRRAPGEPGHRRHRVHRLVRGRHRPLPQLLDALPAAVHRGDGRQEPGDRAGAAPTSRRRPRASCARRSASAGRSARRTAASTSSGRSTTSSSACWSRRPSSWSSATRSSAPTCWARSSTSRPWIGTSRPSPRPGATARCSPAASA